ncbi:hypothetical protein DFP72DRAFT_806307 [Ephemerocybe angulata]|uniref:Uncharacterized protein n=1 Tax=Ephemerocybe angulata TaxID=980116 RepID=A0A8H6I6D6_9AGAR|nr:hypothetical protein DFP72DRAFT_806307 [Tulosesus angulatus]
MGHLRGYSDFFASGFRAVSTRVKRRPTSSFSSATTSSSDTEYDEPPYSSSAIPSILPNVFRPRRQRTLSRRRRPASMMIPTTQSTLIEERSNRRSSLVAFSSRLLDRMHFISGDENTAPASTPPATPRRKRRTSRFLGVLKNSNNTSPSLGSGELWLSTGGPRTPSAPNGGPETHVTIDPFASSPESRSFFIDLSSDGGSGNDDIAHMKQRDSFLSMATSNSNSSPSISLVHVSPRRERPISISTMPLPSRSRRSSFQCRGQSQEKIESWIAEEDESLDFLALTPEYSPVTEGYERDDAAQIDWRQFHLNDLLTVEV